MQKSWYKRWWGIGLILFIAVVGVLLVAAGFYVFTIAKSLVNENNNFSGLQISSSSVYQNEEQKNLIEGQNNYWLGAAKPKITIVEFADFNCPLCQSSFTKIREISLKYKNDVKIIYRDYPVFSGSLNLALAGRCAGEQGLFWLMHDKLFQNQGNFELSQLPEIANRIGADVEKFNDCLSSQKYLIAIQKDFSAAEQLEITGTPAWFINGYKIEGDIPYNLFNELIEKLLNNS